MFKRLILILALSPLAAQAMPFSLAGGQTLPPGATVTSLGFGFPALRAAYAQAFSATTELGAKVGFDYLRGAGELSGTWRMHLAELGTGDLAVRAQLGLYADAGFTSFDPKNPDDAGLLLGAGAALSYPVQESAIFAVTLDVPAAWTFGRGGGAILPLLLGGAFDVALAEGMNVGLTAQIGPRYDAPGAHIARTRLWFEAQLWTTLRVF